MGAFNIVTPKLAQPNGFVYHFYCNFECQFVCILNDFDFLKEVKEEIYIEEFQLLRMRKSN